MNPFDDTQFGAGSGQVTANGGVQSVIDGLTVPPVIRIMNDAASAANTYLGDRFVTTTRGFVLRPGEHVDVPTYGKKSSWYVTTDGTTARVSWISSTGFPT